MKRLLIIVAFVTFMWCGKAHAAITRVQNCENASASVSFVSCSLSSNVTAGDTLVVFCRTTYPVTINSATDSINTSFTQQISWSQSSNPGNTGSLNYVLNSAGGSDTIQCNASGTGNMMIVVSEYNGLSTVDQTTASGATSSTAGNTGNVTTTSANELLFVGCATSISSGQISYTAGTNFTMIATDTQFLRLGAAEDRIVSSTGTYAGTMTFGTANNWECAIGTFAAATAGPSTHPNRRVYAY